MSFSVGWEEGWGQKIAQEEETDVGKHSANLENEN